MKELEEKKRRRLNLRICLCCGKNFDVLFNNFYINAFGQVGEGAWFGSFPDGFAENVENDTSGGAATGLSDVYNSGRFSNGYHDFEGDLFISVN